MSQTNGRKLTSEASGMWRMRTLPKPLGCFTSTAIATTHLSLPRPGLAPCSTPPTRASSTSTLPDNWSRSARTMATRYRCRIVQATRYLVPNVRSSVFADRPFLAVVTCHAASNHVVSGVRVFSRIVPAVTDVWCRQVEHTRRPQLCLQGSAATAHAGHLNPLGQRRPSKYLAHAISS